LKTAIINGKVVTETSVIQATLLLENGKIQAILSPESPLDPSCQVIDADSGTAYGTIADVQNYGSCDIYDVQKGKAHTLVPAIDDVVVEKDVAAGVVKIRPMKGLFDAD
jgi:hypothetical protein